MKRNIFVLINTFIFSVIIWFYVNMNLTYTYALNVPLDFRSSKNQGVSNDIPETIEITVRGKGWGIVKLLASKNLVYRLDLTGYRKDSKVDLSQNAGDILNLPPELSIININPGYLDVSFDNIITKLVKVKNNTSVTTREGYTLIGSAKLSPDSISVTGASSVVSKIKYLNTEYLIFKDINSNITRQVKILDTLGNTVKIEPKNITVNYKIELSAEKTFDDISVEIYGVPQDREVLIIPPKISISLRGGVEVLSKLNPGEIKVGVDFKTIENDEQGYITPTIELTDELSVIKSEPQKFQYIIKKKATEN
ncbi:MAG: CdaR family protein [Ignavibacteria bacterium]|nr:CdaR family protein [Ignavibacteria bacterium]